MTTESIKDENDLLDYLHKLRRVQPPSKLLTPWGKRQRDAIVRTVNLLCLEPESSPVDNQSPPEPE